MTAQSLKAAMYIDEQSLVAYQTNRAAWLKTNWHNSGLDNQLFEKNIVPFALDSPGQEIALKKYARAYFAGNAEGPPVRLLTIEIPAEEALYHIVHGDIKIMLESQKERPEDTVGFTKPVTSDNFPFMSSYLYLIDQQQGENLLNACREFFPDKVRRVRH